MKIIILDYSVPRVAIIKNVPSEITSEQYNDDKAVYNLESFLEQNGFH